MNEEEAIDILKNCIADYVIGEYCSKCEDSQICESKNEDCYYLQSIDAVLNLLKKKDKIIYEIAKSNVKLKGYDVEETYINNTISFYTKYIENLERNPHWRKK